MDLSLVVIAVVIAALAFDFTNGFHDTANAMATSIAEVRWGVAGRMVIAWALTLPAAAVVGAIASEVATTGDLGTILVGVVGAGIAVAIYLVSRRNPVDAGNVNEPERAATPVGA